MQFTITAAALMAFVSSGLAQVAGFDAIRAPADGELVPAGKTYTVTWDAAPAQYDDETISIILLAGSSPSTLVPGAEPVAAGIVNSVGTFEWAVPGDLGDDAVYGLKIQLESDAAVFQYSFPFHIEASEDGGKGNTTTTTPSSTKNGQSSSSTAAPKPTGASNSSTVTPPKTTLTTTATGESTPTSTGDSEPVPSNGATRGAAGTIAILGGLAIAALGL